ncbi:FUSC family protein [Acidisphaera sp. L21]|uniref:FUSC family protein n=1 Tax=Acidisphaera sp. L21 TaxID=1641851 RepID=UPI00131CB502|nr:FUSC family protein [Acidisphaera sp. L21]
MRSDRIGWAVNAPWQALSNVWNRMIASDPGLLRLFMAFRGTLSVFVMTVVALLLGHLLDAAPVEFASGITFSLMLPFLAREPTRRERQRTMVMLALPAAGAAIVTTVMHGRGVLGDSFFLVLVFLCFLLQARSPQGIALGLVAVVISYVGLYLELPVSTLPIQMLSVLVAIPVVWFIGIVALPLRPARTLRRTVQAVQGRAAMVLRDAGGLAAGQPATVQRLRRSLAQLNEAALAADDQMALLDPVGSAPLRLHLMDLELAAARLANAPLDVVAGQNSRRQAARIRAHERRLRRGRWSRHHLRGPNTNSPQTTVAAALADLMRAASALGLCPVAPTIAQPPAPVVRPAPGPLAWRIALRVTLASAMAMAGGMALSPQRWFWAVVTVYVVFLNARSRGDTIYKGAQRLSGTLLGLVCGLLLATLLAGDVVVQCAALLAAIFGMYYFIMISYTIGIFCVTMLLGLLYSLLGASLEPLLVLRLEETAIGAVSAILVAAYVLPVRTRDQVKTSGAAVLRALSLAVATCRDALAGKPGANPVAAMRAVDRQVADLRLALLPLRAGRFLMRRTELERPVPALLDCVHWLRVLAVSATAADPDAVAQADAIERRLAALAAGERPIPSAPVPAIPPAFAPARDALNRLEHATADLTERLAIGALQGFQLER